MAETAPSAPSAPAATGSLVGERERLGSTVAVASRPPRRINTFLLFTYIVLSLAAIIYIAPFLWMLGKSLMNLFEATSTQVIPTQLQFENYEIVWDRFQFG